MTGRGGRGRVEQTYEYVNTRDSADKVSAGRPGSGKPKKSKTKLRETNNLKFKSSRGGRGALPTVGNAMTVEPSSFPPLSSFSRRCRVADNTKKTDC